MKTLGLLIVVGALGYAYVMNNPDVLKTLLPPPPKKEQSAEQRKQEAVEHHEEEAMSGDHLFPADLTS